MFNRSGSSSVIRNYPPSESTTTFRVVVNVSLGVRSACILHMKVLSLFNHAIIIVTYFYLFIYFIFATHHVIVRTREPNTNRSTNSHYIVRARIIFDPHSACERRYSSCYTRARDRRDYRAKYLADTRTHYLCIQVQRCSC